MWLSSISLCHWVMWLKPGACRIADSCRVKAPGAIEDYVEQVYAYVDIAWTSRQQWQPTFSCEFANHSVARGGPDSRANRKISIFCIRLCFGIGYISAGLVWIRGIWEGYQCLNVAAMWGQRRLSVRLPLAPLALMPRPQNSHQLCSAVGNAHKCLNMACLGPRFVAALVLWQLWKLQQLTGLLWRCFLKTCSIRALQVP